MANLKFSNAVRNAMLDVISSQAGTSALIKIFSGTQPAGGGAETTKLAQLTCSSSALAPAASAGVLTLNAVTSDTLADATGTATWFRLETSGGTHIMDGDVSVTDGGGDMQLDSTSIIVNGTVSLSGPNTIVAPNAP